MANILIESDGPCLTLRLNHPGKRNALNLAMWQQLAEIFENQAVDRTIQLVIVRGAGPEAFAAGGDLAEFPSARSTLSQARHYHAQVERALCAIDACPCPTIAAIHGPCYGGGLEIAAVCDLRVGDDSATFGAPIHRLGFSMAPAELRWVLRGLGAAVIREILLEGRVLSASEAYAKGLLHRQAAAGQLDETLEEMRRGILAGAPQVARWHKHWLRRLRDNPAPLSSDEIDAGFAFLESEDYAEGLTAFLEKRPPRFTGR